ncbi:MAG: hypothetical protein ABR950_03265 [Candidatus Dormibacteria bacterium]
MPPTLGGEGLEVVTVTPPSVDDAVTHPPFPVTPSMSASAVSRPAGMVSEIFNGDLRGGVGCDDAPASSQPAAGVSG